MSRDYEQVVVRTTDGNTYTGKIHLLGHSRIHDLLNQGEPFIAIKGVRKNSEEQIHWILLNRSHIVSVEPPPGSETGEYHTPGFARGDTKVF